MVVEDMRSKEITPLYLVTNHIGFYAIALLKAFFVVRGKHKMKFDIIEDKHYNNPATGIMVDQIVRFSGSKTKNKYPEAIRRVIYYDSIGNRTFVFYTNNTALSAEDIAELYKNRWSVELFYKWLKQFLHVKEFYGTSENSVNIQINRQALLGLRGRDANALQRRDDYHAIGVARKIVDAVNGTDATIG